MPIPPYTITFQPSSSGTALVSRVIVSRPSGASGVHEGPMVPVLKTYQSLGGPDRISSPGGNTVFPVPRQHLHQVSLVRDAQVAPLQQDLPQRRVVGSCLIDSTLTTHPRRTTRSPQFFSQVTKFSALRALYIYVSHSPASHHRYNASKSKSSNI
jgi:hypothetical protein